MTAKDQLTRDYLKQWGQKDIPTGVITDGDVRPGRHQAFALLAWTQSREERWPLVLMKLALLSPQGTSSVGGMLLSLPLTPKTEIQVCATLEAFGWDGRVWPHADHEWPEGTQDEAPILNLLKQIDLGATMTFPNNTDYGVPTSPVFVARRSGTFATAPFGHIDIPKHLITLRKLANDPSPFKSDWTKR